MNQLKTRNTFSVATQSFTRSNLLLFLEAIKYRKLLLNNGLKVSKDLAVFLGIIVCL